MRPFDPFVALPPIQLLVEIVRSLGWAVPIMLMIGAIQIWILVKCVFRGVDGIRITLYFACTLTHLTSTFLAAVAADLRICQVLGLAGMTDPALLASNRSQYLLGLYGGAFITFISAFVGVLFFGAWEIRRQSSAGDSMRKATPNQAIEGTAR